MKKYLLIFCLGLIFFAVVSLYSYSDICCMFSSNRYYGWPYPYLSLHKTVETLEEANRIKTDSTLALAKDGWQLSFSGGMLKSSPFGTVGNLIVDIIFSFVFAGISFFVGKKILARLKP